MYLLGLDIGSSSIKATIVDAESGEGKASCFYPEKEMPISAPQAGFAEQDPEMWWEYTCRVLKEVIRKAEISEKDIKAIGISYQMHGLVMVDKNKEIIRPSIIWCDSRAAGIGDKAFRQIGEKECLSRLLNSPGNFTASKLKWVKDKQPEIYERIYKIMLPGDYIAMKLTGEIRTTASGLSEGIMWDFRKHSIAGFLLDHFGFDQSIIPDLAPGFGDHGSLSRKASEETGLAIDTPVTYRAGDQPNNAFSLKVLDPGEIAAVAGTSGVVYGVSDEIRYDPESRINTFAHVNHTAENTRLGVLLCINGSGILNAWIRSNMAGEVDYEAINRDASPVNTGSDGLVILPFGNGAERMLGNISHGAKICKLDFNIHSKKHIYRAAHEGIAFAFRYGLDIMKDLGIKPGIIRAGYGNMFLSPVFRETLSNISGARIELYNTDGSRGAARAAGIGAGIYQNFDEAFMGLSIVKEIIPDPSMQDEYEYAYHNWLVELNRYLNNN
ncbi:MAG: carbohydrate kinase [Bacteroidales bacterium]|nr:carbohydrate kinase [Bacteroidales bacterium]